MKHAVTFAALSLLAACGGGSTSGGGTSNSVFVGTYSGSTSLTVTSSSGTRSASQRISIYVHEDGLVQLGEDGSTIYASGLLRDDSVYINGDAAILVAPDCSGAISISGSFSIEDEEGAVFDGVWSSTGASCFGVAGEVTGSVTADRTSPSTGSSRVIETNSPALRQAYEQLAR